MAELPEIWILSKQMTEKLAGKQIKNIEVRQEKCLNMDKEDMEKQLKGRKITEVTCKGKWIFIHLSQEGYLLINVGMGGDILYFEEKDMEPTEYQFKINHIDGSGFTCKFFWFGHVHYLSLGELEQHEPTKNIAASPIEEEFTLDYFKVLIHKNRGNIKGLLLNQKKVGGIGNMYIHDILFRAALHPEVKACNLSEEQIEKLYHVIAENMKNAIESKGCIYEKDFFGNYGELPPHLVGYKENEPCPVCGTIIEKIKTGSTASYICRSCQKTK